MAISLVSNSLSLSLHKNFSRSQSDTSVALQRLSSGLRINSSKDDTAGLSISNRMTTQIQGMNQSVRNTNDAISMLQVAEAGMSGVTELLQRGRELTVEAANATMSMVDKQSIQKEIEQIFTAIDHISENTEFNGLKILSSGGSTSSSTDTSTLTDTTASSVASSSSVVVPDYTDKKLIIEMLQKSWLEQSEQLITDYYGITASNTDMDIILQDTIVGNATAYVAASFIGTTLDDLSLNIDVEEVIAAWAYPDALDQLIAHEMTHAVMDATMNMTSFETWFIEGTAEFLPGGDERLRQVLAVPTTSANLVLHIDNIRNAWNTTSLDYATAYAATRYLHSIAGGNGVKDVLMDLAANNPKTLDAYFAGAGIVGITSTTDFINDFKTNGAVFIDAMDLTNNDTGGIGGFDADGGARVTTWAGTVPDTSNPTLDPLTGFNEIWPTFAEAVASITTPTVVEPDVINYEISLKQHTSLQFQVGADTGMTINAGLISLSIDDLGLSNIDVTEDTDTALLQFDAALDAINKGRGKLGATMSRMDSVVNTLHVTSNNMSASRSHILDADFAIEMTSLVKGQILQQAGMAMMAQANSSSSVVLGLL